MRHTIVNRIGTVKNNMLELVEFPQTLLRSDGQFLQAL
jgi:hypothetical protein